MPAFIDRRSERFAALLDERGNGRRSHRHNPEDAELSPLVCLAGRVAALPDVPPPTDEFRTGLRAMLLAKIEREGVESALSQDKTVRIPARLTNGALAGAGRSVPAGPVGRLRIVVLAGVTAGAIALSGVSAASTNALPGDTLYQVKRSTEQAQLALAGSDQSRGALHLEFARQRLLEATKVGPDLVATALTAMNQETVDGFRLIAMSATQHGDPTVLESIAGFVVQQRQLLDQYSAALAPAGDTLVSSRTLLTEVEARARALAAAVVTGCIPHRSDVLGPMPSRC